MNASRQSGFSPNPISHLELMAWAILSGIDLKTWEVRLIREMDIAYLKANAKEKKHG